MFSFYVVHTWLTRRKSSELVIATAGTDEKVKFVEQHGAKGIN